MLMAEREHRMKENGSQGSEMVERISAMIIAPNGLAYPERMWAQREWKNRCGTKQWHVEIYQQSTQNCSSRTGIPQGVCALDTSMSEKTGKKGRTQVALSSLHQFKDEKTDS